MSAGAGARAGWRQLALLLGLGLALRLFLVPRTGIAHPDELFQYFEAAHRLVFGDGVVPWEYRYGMRSWLLPLLIAGPMWAGDAIAPQGMLYMLLPRALVATLSLGVIAGAWAIGRRISPVHALVAGVVAAVWPELVHFAPHVLTEPAAVALIIPAAALLGSERPSRLALSGVLFGFAAIMRFQYLPAIGVLALVGTLRRREAWWPLVIGGVGAALVGALIDLAMGAVPFSWLAINVRENLLHDRASHYGVMGPQAYFEAAGIVWGAWGWPIVALALVGARRQPALMAAALVNLALHMAIGHKEYRFVLLTTALLVLLAAIGTGDLLAWARRRFALPAALALWCLAAASIAASGRASFFDWPVEPARPLYADLRGDAGLCGVATWKTLFAAGGGYTMLRRPVPILSFDAGEAGAMARGSGAFNRIIAPLSEAAQLPPGFARVHCRATDPRYPPSCIFARPGGCDGTAEAFRINRVLERLDQ